MSTVQATAQQGETLDAIVWRVLGAWSGGIVEQAYELNRDLADIGAVLPEGRLVILPALSSAAANSLDIIKLWE